MKDYTATCDLHAPVEQAWAQLASVQEWPMWTPTIVVVRPLDTGILAVGQRFHIEQPRLHPAEWRVSRVQPGLSFEWEAHAPGLKMVAGHTLEATNAFATRLILTFRLQGLLSILGHWLYGELIQSYLAQEAASFKSRLECAETGHSSSPHSMR